MFRFSAWLTIIGLLFANSAHASMSSANFQIGSDSINSGGNDTGSSDNYKMYDTVGEQGTGYSASGNYSLHAGYRQADEFIATLSFEIVSSTDADATSYQYCSFGAITPGSVYTCDYALRIQTDSPGGFSAQVGSVGHLSNGTHDISDVADGAVTAYSEEYGFAFTSSSEGGYQAANDYGAPSTIVGSYNGQDSAVPLNSASGTAVAYTSGPFDGQCRDSSNGGCDSTWDIQDLTIVTHKLSASMSTPVGSYTHQVYWEVSALP